MCVVLFVVSLIIIILILVWSFFGRFVVVVVTQYNKQYITYIYNKLTFISVYILYYILYTK